MFRPEQSLLILLKCGRSTGFWDDINTNFTSKINDIPTGIYGRVAWCCTERPGEQHGPSKRMKGIDV